MQIGMAIPLNPSGFFLVIGDPMYLKSDADRIDILRKTVELATKLNHPFKVMADRDTFQQLFTDMPDEFQETQDHYFWTPDGHTKIMMYRNDNISGVWVEFQ